MTVERRLTFTHISVLLFLVAGMLLCPKLWTSERYFPLVPAFDFLPVLSYGINLAYLYAMGIMLVLSLIYPHIRIFGIVFLLLFALFILLDINRLQPWVFQYFFMLLVFYAFYPGNVFNKGILIKDLRLIISGIYFWSGVHKLNPNYFDTVQPWFKEPFNNLLPDFLQPVVHLFFYGVPFFEILTGAALLIPFSRKAAVIFATVLHLTILLITGPAGYNYNVVIWPWNIAMIVFLFLLFYKIRLTPSNDRVKPSSLPGLVVLLFFWILPALNLFNRWPSYLSSNLYSGNTANGTIYLSDKTVGFLPDKLKSGYLENESTPNIIPVKTWAMNELNVPPFPEKKVFLTVKDFFKRYSNNSADAVLMFAPKNTILEKREPEIY